MSQKTDSHTTFPHIFEPLDLGHVTLPNRMLMGSMHVGLEEEWFGLKKMGAYFAARAAGEAGLIVTGGVAPNRFESTFPLDIRRGFCMSL